MDRATHLRLALSKADVDRFADAWCAHDRNVGDVLGANERYELIKGGRVGDDFVRTHPKRDESTGVSAEVGSARLHTPNATAGL